jgi:hypothetical protein
MRARHLLAASVLPLAAAGCASAAPVAGAPTPAPHAIHEDRPMTSTPNDDGPAPIWVPVKGSVALEGDLTFTLVGLTLERMEPPPGARPGSIRDHAVVTGELAGARVAIGLGPGDAAWARDLRVTLVDADDRPPGRAALRFERLGEPGPGRALRLARREPVAVAPGITAELAAHGHKDAPPGRESPLIVHMRYVEGGRAYEGSTSLFPPREATWDWHALRFSLRAHEYGEHMDVTVAERPLRPVAARVIGGR